MQSVPEKNIPHFTAEQYQAVFTSGINLIVTAGAGSGKTRVLVERFMAQLQQNPQWSLASLVAITFTEKAAREMRERVRTTVLRRINEADSAEEREFWRKHEAALDSARIGTIHSLCAQILRANPVEAALDPGFQVLDDVEASLLRDEAVESALAILLSTKNSATALLSHYDIQTVRHILRAFASRSLAKPFITALADTTPEALLETWRQLWLDDASATLHLVHKDEDFHQDLHWIDQAPQPKDDKLWAAWELVLGQREILAISDDPEYIRDIFERIKKGINLQGGAASKWGGEDGLAECKAILRQIREKAERYLGEFLPLPGELDALAADSLILWWEAIRTVSAEFQRLKNDRDALDFDDLELLTLELLENYPQVARRYADHEFNHVMVDEFQDTNDIQRRIVYALCGIDPVQKRAVPGRLFVVGDPKQSIYAFRGADVSVFEQVRDELLACGGQQISLNKSFRSHERLVGMYNSVFSQVLRRTSGPMAYFAVEYEAMEAHRNAKAHHQTAVRLLLLQKPKSSETHLPKLDAGEMRRWEAAALGEQLQLLVQSGAVVWDKESGNYRPVHYGDMAILFQSMNNTPQYEQVFQQLGLPYITVAGKGYFDRQEVWDMMNLLAALHSPANDLALAAVLRSPMFSLSDDALLALRLRRKDGETLSLWAALMTQEIDSNWPSLPVDDLPAIGFARQVLQSLNALTGRVTIAELLDYALELTGFEATLTGLSNGARRRANINKLLTVARQSKRISLGEFNAFLRDRVSTEAREGEAALEAEGVITLMSVHKSKGLEFPVVVLADCSWSRRQDNPHLLVDPVIGPACKVRLPDAEKFEEPFIYQLARKYAEQRDLAERQRLFYVAATRAQDFLLFSGQAKKEEKGHSWMKQLRQALSDGTTSLMDELEAGEVPQILEMAWGHLALHIPPVPDLRGLSAYSQPKTAWQGRESVPAFDEQALRTHLPLVHEVPVTTRLDKWHINATDLEKLGKNMHPEARAEFRWMLLRDMPRPVRPIIGAYRERQSAYAVGNVVHKALQVGLMPSKKSEATLLHSLDTYAWDEGVSDPERREEIVEEAWRLLEQYETSEVAAMLLAADAVYREIPFVYEHSHYVIHGVIDTLFHFDERWHVLDFKTSHFQADEWQDYETYSGRYLYQMAAYASAVEEQTGQSPRVWLHYLQPNQLYELPEHEWREAIALLDREIGSILA